MMESILLNLFLLLALGAAVLTVVTDQTLSAVIYSGVLSTLAALCYVFVGAPDVALAEVIIGSVLSTVVFLTALRKYKLFTVCWQRRGEEEQESARKVAVLIRNVLKAHDLESHLIISRESIPDCDLTVREEEEGVTLRGEMESVYMRELREAAQRAGLGPEVIWEDTMLENTLPVGRDGQ